MPISFRQLSHEESGLTLIELLVVMLVMAILASIALPAFAEQAGKADDARAKQHAHSAYLAIEACRLDSPFGSYENCDANALREIEPTLPPNPELKVNGLGPSTYTIIVRSRDMSSRTFRVKRNAKGILSFPCTAKGVGGCPKSKDWGGS